MTKEEINKWLSNLKDDIGKAQHQELWHYAEALDMAIEALSAKRTGKWNHPYHYGLALPEHQCSECGYWEYADSKSNYCPNCGADMRGAEE